MSEPTPGHTQSILEKKANQHISSLRDSRLELLRLVKAATPGRMELVKEHAWRCITEFPSGALCNTVNALMSNSKVVRKTCSKCARPRKNKLTIMEELQRELLIEQLMITNNVSRLEAIQLLDTAIGDYNPIEAIINGEE